MITDDQSARGRARVGRRHAGLLAAPAVAGIGYTAAWLIGLAVWPSNLAVDANDAKVASTFAAHESGAIAQFIFVEGLAAIALAVVALALSRAARRSRRSGLALTTLVAGLTVATISLVQCVLGVVLAGHAAPDGETGRAGDLFDAVNRLDGVKMLVLAVLAAAGVPLALRASALPRWLGYVAAALAAALVVSGAGYLALDATVAQAVFVSGPLLLVWVTGTGVSLARAVSKPHQ